MIPIYEYKSKFRATLRTKCVFPIKKNNFFLSFESLVFFIELKVDLHLICFLIVIKDFSFLI